MVHLVTDSTSYLTAKEAEELKAHVVKIHYTVGGVPGDEGLADTYDEFEARLRIDPVGSSSQPSPDAFAQLFATFPADDSILVVTLSAELSGTYNSAVLAAHEYPNARVVDSRHTGGSLYFLLKTARKAIDDGLDVTSAAARVQAEIARVGVAFTLETLDSLRRGGRIGRVGHSVGNLLSLRPVLYLQDGVVNSIGLARGRAAKLQKLSEQPPDATAELTVHYLGNEGDRDQLLTLLATRFPKIAVRLSKLGPVLGLHLGLGAVGVAWRECEG